QAEDGIRGRNVTGVQTCALPISVGVQVWFETVRRSAPFAGLPWSAYEATLDMSAGKYPSADFAELRPRLVWDRDAETITGRPGEVGRASCRERGERAVGAAAAGM